MKVVQACRKGTMRTREVDPQDLEATLTSLSKSQGEGELSCLYRWSHGDHTLLCYGWYDGDAGFENQTELPPGGESSFLDKDSSVQLLFGDIFLCKKGSSYVDLDIGEYSEFYTYACGGFDDCESETDSEDMNSESEDEDYVEEPEEMVSEEEVSETEVSSGDSELDEDTYDY